MSASSTNGTVQPGPTCPLPTSCDLRLYHDLPHNLACLHAVTNLCSDVVYRQITLFSDRNAALVYLSGADSRPLDADVLPPLTIAKTEPITQAVTLDMIEARFVHLSDVERVQTLQKVIEKLFEFRAILLIDGEIEALSLGQLQFPARAIEESTTEATIRGPHEGFTERVQTSIVLIRNKIRTPDLKTEFLTIGTYTKTSIVLCYIEGIVNPSLVQEVRTRLDRIQIDAILESGYIEELIEDDSYSPFPQFQDSERPDVVAAMLLEGRIAILVDGTPFALCAPINLWGALTSPEDYYERYLITNLLRFIRFTFTWIALLLPSLYIALTTFHQEALPTNLLLSVASARENTPFPAVVEAFIMELAFEGLREAGIRMPKQVGQAVSIVGALVIGQAAVDAGMVSAPMVIIVSMTGVASFCIPRYNLAISLRLLRFPIMLLAGVLGMLGVFFGIFAILIHLSGLRSLGIPYLQPIAPFSAKGLKDTFIRAPWWAMRTRPAQDSKRNLRRQGPQTSPGARAPRSRKPSPS